MKSAKDEDFVADNLDSFLATWKAVKRPAKQPSDVRSRSELLLSTSSAVEAVGDPIVGREQLASSLRKMRELFGPGGDMMVYQMGLDAGRRSPLVPAKDYQVFSELFSDNDWGEIQSVDTDKALTSITVVLRSGFECEGQKSPAPNSQFVRGHLAGTFTQILGEEATCDEVRCIATGDDVCEFIVSRKSHNLIR